jgi:hypothetical protein
MIIISVCFFKFFKYQLDYGYSAYTIVERENPFFYRNVQIPTSFSRSRIMYANIIMCPFERLFQKRGGTF